MKSIQTLVDLLLISCLALAALVVGVISPLSATIAHPIISTIDVLFAPGYAFIAALFPRKTTLDNGVRLGLSFGLSIAIVPLLEMVLNYSVWGVRVSPTLAVIAVFTLACVAAAAIRRRRLPLNERFAINWPVREVPKAHNSPALQGSTFDRMLTIAVVLAIGASVAAGSFTILVPKQAEQFTEFYILGANNTLNNYTTQYKAGIPSPTTVVIVNNEGRDVTYNLVVSANNSTQRSVVYSEEVTVPSGQQWEKQIDLVLNEAGDNRKLDFSLYADHTTADPYRDVHLWVNVTA